MGRPILIDSSWYIGIARRGDDPLRALSFMAESRDIATCGIIVAEVGRGIRERKHLSRYRAAWSLMMFIRSDRQRWEQTLELAWTLDRRGIVLPIQDLHIAACAAHIGAVVLTLDGHFQQIPGIDATERIL